MTSPHELSGDVHYLHVYTLVMKLLEPIVTRPNVVSAVALATILAGCASSHPATPVVPPQAPVQHASLHACVVAAPVCTVCPTCPTSAPLMPELAVVEQVPSSATEPQRGRLEKASWSQLVDWQTDEHTEALIAFERGCSVLKVRPEWADVCTKASALTTKKITKSEATLFFRVNFQPYQVVNADESVSGTVTGYYEPLLLGSRTRTDVFRYPIFAPPEDLITVDLGEVYPDLKHRRLRGRIVGNKLVPYYERADIDAVNSANAPLKGLEIAWVDNVVDLFFLQIQGSGQIQLPDGTRFRVGYADQNGHPFRSLAGLLIRRGEIRAERASMQGIKVWAERYPAKVRQFMNGNPSFVFFKEISADGPGPIGTLGVPLTAERSIAVDPRVIPLGVPVFLSTTFPGSKQSLNRLMVAQDTGGAIAGAVRVDFFWGFGEDAGALAGRMRQKGTMWVLLPIGYEPDAVLPKLPSATPP